MLSSDQVRRSIAIECAWGPRAVLFPGRERARFARMRPRAEALPRFRLENEGPHA